MIKRPTYKTADAETRTNAMREIALMLGEINNAIILNGNRNCPYEVIESMGYKRNGNVFEKKGIRFSINKYSSSYEWYVSWGFYFGECYPGCHLHFFLSILFRDMQYGESWDESLFGNLS